MKNSILFRVWVLAGAMLLASGGWGFTTDKDVVIGSQSDKKRLEVTGTLKIGSVNDTDESTETSISRDGLVTAAEGIATIVTDAGGTTTNARNYKIPTTAAVKAYVDDAFGISN